MSRANIVGAALGAVLFASMVGTCGVMLIKPMFELPGMLESALQACARVDSDEACFEAMNLPKASRHHAYRTSGLLETPEGFEEFSATNTCVLNDVADVRGVAYFATHNQKVAGTFRRIDGEWVLLRFGPPSEIPRACGSD